MQFKIYFLIQYFFKYVTKGSKVGLFKSNLSAFLIIFKPIIGEFIANLFSIYDYCVSNVSLV